METPQTPVQLLREASAAIVKISLTSSRFDRNKAIRELAELTPKWVAVQDLQPQVDELKQRVQDLELALSVSDRQLNDASDAYNDVQQTVVDALTMDSLDPLKAFAQIHPGFRGEHDDIDEPHEAVAA